VPRAPVHLSSIHQVFETLTINYEEVALFIRKSFYLLKIDKFNKERENRQ